MDLKCWPASPWPEPDSPKTLGPESREPKKSQFGSGLQVSEVGTAEYMAPEATPDEDVGFKVGVVELKVLGKSLCHRRIAITRAFCECLAHRPRPRNEPVDPVLIIGS